MRRPTLAQAISAGIGQPVGLCSADISGNAAIVNLAQDRLIMDPLAPDEGWWGGWVVMRFNVTVTQSYAYIVTPYDIARVILMDVCQKPVFIRNGFYEYLQFGVGLQPKGCTTQVCSPNTMQAFERDTVFTLNDFASTPMLLRVYPTDSADVGRRIVLQGPDQNGVPVTAVDTNTQASILGETVYLTLPFSTSVNQFSGITGILKDETVGRVQVFMIDPTTGNSSLLTQMEPHETTAQYRRYLINGLPCGCCSPTPGPVQVSAQCKLDFVPVVSPSDYLTIPNIPALMEEVQAIRYSRMDSPDAARNEAKHHAKAIQLLNGQLDHFLGKTRTAINVPLFGSDRLMPQLI